MSKIIMRTTAASPEGTYEEGKEYPENEITKKYVENGYAEYIEKPEEKKKVEKPEKEKQENEILSLDDLEQRKGGHYYLDGKHFAHGKEEAKQELEKLNKEG